MDKILKRDLLDDSLTDKEVMEKHRIFEYRRLRQLYLKAQGYNLKAN